MEQKIRQIFYSVGILPSYFAYSYLMYAVCLVIEEPRRLHNICQEVYLPVADHYGTKAANVAKNIRTVRDIIWSNDVAREYIQNSGYFKGACQTLYPRELIGILVHLVQKEMAVG